MSVIVNDAWRSVIARIADVASYRQERDGGNTLAESSGDAIIARIIDAGY